MASPSMSSHQRSLNQASKSIGVNPQGGQDRDREKERAREKRMGKSRSRRDQVERCDEFSMLAAEALHADSLEKEVSENFSITLH